MRLAPLYRNALLLTGLLLSGIAVVQAADWPRQITDSRGTHTLESQPQRIVSTSVTLTGSLLAIDSRRSTNAAPSSAKHSSGRLSDPKPPVGGGSYPLTDLLTSKNLQPPEESPRLQLSKHPYPSSRWKNPDRKIPPYCPKTSSGRRNPPADRPFIVQIVPVSGGTRTG